jgi:hypothetical protein
MTSRRMTSRHESYRPNVNLKLTKIRAFVGAVLIACLFALPVAQANAAPQFNGAGPSNVKLTCSAGDPSLGLPPSWH